MDDLIEQIKQRIIDLEDENMCLREALIQERTDNVDARYDLARANAKIEQLQETLRFYANAKNYDSFIRNHASMGEHEASHILDDAGSVAREALGEK
jgi:thermostable 8-oxoguanine DNA glycosylase